MNLNRIVLICGMCVAAGIPPVFGFEVDTIPTEFGEIEITFIGHGSLMFKWRERIFHVDPWSEQADYTKLPKADVILITHDHRDHLDLDTIELLRKPTTQVVHPVKCEPDIPNSVAMKNGDSGVLKLVTIDSVAAYNIVHLRPDGKPYHPKGEGNGYVLRFADVAIYVAGDTEPIPEMKNLGVITAAFLPMNLPYTMTPEMVAEAAGWIQSKILYPYHYGDTDPQKIVELLKDTKIDVRIRSMR